MTARLSHAHCDPPMPPTPPRDPIDVSNDDEADFEYEVEPVDEHVVAQEAARGREDVAKAQAAIDVDAIYREMESNTAFDAAFEKFRPRFSIRTLLVTMTLAALALAAWSGGWLRGSTFAGFICVSLLVLGSAHAWLNFHENQRREKLIARRERELRRARNGGSPDDEDEPDDELTNDPFGDLYRMIRNRMRFTIKELLALTALTAVLLSLVQLTGGVPRAAAALGTLAITGFALQMADIAMPRWLLIGWWCSLAGFCVLTLASIAMG